MTDPRRDSVLLFEIVDRLDRIEKHMAKSEDNVTELWMPKKRLGLELGVSPRWIEQRLSEGLPCRVIAGKTMFRLSRVEDWLTSRGHLKETG